ncbi:MAG TPA: hypothetical protein VEC36_11005 [Patescibacteria group bacterium]|nr:hypothetical protein [Patescibacteria group bacterium]
MRNPHFIAEHRGGLLKKEHHRLLMLWAIACAEHVLKPESDERLHHSIAVGKTWAEGRVPTGYAMKASVTAHAVARELLKDDEIAVARAVGQAVATAHMADHSLGGALYALKAVARSGGDVDAERVWQIAQLPEEVEELVLSGLREKGKHFKIRAY